MAKILVAEDDEYLKELYTIFLKAVNHEIVIASSANEVKKRFIHLLLMLSF